MLKIMTSGIMFILFSAGIGFVVGFDLAVDMYNCLYNIDVYTKNTQDILSIISNTQLDNKYMIKYDNYDLWVQSKIQNMLKLDLSNEAYILEKNMMNILDSKANDIIITSGNKEEINNVFKNIFSSDFEIKEEKVNIKLDDSIGDDSNNDLI